MCKFFSACSDGKGKTVFFRIEDIATIMSEGNKESYDFNSHTSILKFHGITGLQEDKWNKWEYDVDKKELKADQINTDDDRNYVEKAIKSYLKGKDLLYLRNAHNLNSGNRNSGNYNSGNLNSGNCNSGNYNSGNRNSGDYNSGNRNSGDCNSGYYNSGDCNSGYRNSGDCNSGNYNSGNRNSGACNSGNCNSNTVLGSFCSESIYHLFNKPCTNEEHYQVYNLDWSWFKLNEWIPESKMTRKEKKEYHNYKVIGGYLKTISYKDAWKKCPKNVLKQIKQLPNFDKKVFNDITGLT